MAVKEYGAQAVMSYCVKHPTEENEMFCTRCKIPTCTTCLRTDHPDHEVETILKLSKKLTNKRDDFLEDLRKQFGLKQKSFTRTFNEVQCHNHNLLVDNTQSLDERRKDLQDNINELIEKDIRTCRAHNVALVKDSDEVKQKHIENECEIQAMLCTFENTTLTGLDLIEYHENLRSRIEKMGIAGDVKLYRDGHVFSAGKVNKDELQQMVGNTKDVGKIPTTPQTLSTFSYKTHPDVDDTSTFPTFVEVFHFKYVPVYFIRPISRDKAWITYGQEKELRLMNINGQCLNSVPRETGNPSFYVTDDDCFISARKYEQVVLEIDQSGSTTKVMDTSPLIPVAVGKALQGNILVALVDSFSDTRSTDSDRKVQMVSSAGKVLYTYEYTDDGVTPVLTSPTRPTQNFNSNVCVINNYETEDKKYKGNICVFFEDGGLKFVYIGKDTDFNPIDVCCDSLCNIICIIQLKNDYCVHIIDSDGTFMKYLFTYATCIPTPKSIALYKDRLWVGSMSGLVCVYSYEH